MLVRELALIFGDNAVQVLLIIMGKVYESVFADGAAEVKVLFIPIGDLARAGLVIFVIKRDAVYKGLH